MDKNPEVERTWVCLPLQKYQFAVNDQLKSLGAN